MRWVGKQAKRTLRQPASRMRATSYRDQKEKIWIQAEEEANLCYFS
jgi:hypothetical protein